MTARPLEGWTCRWAGRVLVAEGPSGRRSIGEVSARGGVLLHPTTGDELLEVKCPEPQARVAVEGEAIRLGAGVDAPVDRRRRPAGPTPGTTAARLLALVVAEPGLTSSELASRLGIRTAGLTTECRRLGLRCDDSAGAPYRWHPPTGGGDVRADREGAPGRREPLIPEPSTAPAAVEPSREGPGASPVAEAGEVPVEPSPPAALQVDEPMVGPGSNKPPVADGSSVGVAQRGGRTEDAPATSAPLPARPPTDPGRKDDAGKPRWSLLPWAALGDVVGVLEYGARKYEVDGWRRVPDAARYRDALLRHLVAQLEGETHDRESGLSHAAHAAANALFLLEFEGRAGR